MNIFVVNKYMKLALELAKKGEGKTFPNPLVGAVIVKNGRIIGRGFHKKAGLPHAEIVALKEAGKRAEGATLFCTFEPCAHFGRTGPCVDEVIRAGIKEVFIGMIDPNPITKGKGLKKLKKAGIKVHTGFLKDEIALINDFFIKAMVKKLPLVTVKIAQSLDGKTATATGKSKWITSYAARRHAHSLRSFFDAIMVGIGTVLKDNPRLECNSHDNHGLVKIVIDSELKIPLSAKLFKTKQKVIIASIKKDKSKEFLLKKIGAKVIYTKPDKGMVDLRELMKKLNDLEIRSILVEGGSRLLGSFFDNKLADRIHLYIAPKIIGGEKSLSCIGGRGVVNLSSVTKVDKACEEKVGPDIFITGNLIYN